jgi:hypothetical protein
MYISLCLHHCIIHLSAENSKFIFCACALLANHTSMLSNSTPVQSVVPCGILLEPHVHCYDGSDTLLVHQPQCISRTPSVCMHTYIFIPIRLIRSHSCIFVHLYLNAIFICNLSLEYAYCMCF